MTRGVSTVVAGVAVSLLAAGCASAPAGGAAAPSPAPPGTAAPPATTPGRGASVSYGKAFTATYRLDRRDTINFQFASAVQTQASTRTIWLAVAAASGDASGLRTTITLDSFKVDAAVAMTSAAALDSARGTRWTATLTPGGRLVGLQADRTTSAGAQVESMLPALFAPLPAGAVRAGATWTDTTDVPMRADAFEVREQAVTRYAATGGSAVDGRSTITIQGQGTFTRKGTGTQQGQSLEIASSGTRSTTHQLGTDGVPAGMQGTETSEFTIVVPAVGQSITGSQAGSYSAIRTTVR